MSGNIATRLAQKTRVCNSKMKVWWRAWGAKPVIDPVPPVATPKSFAALRRVAIAGVVGHAPES
jgi:hypothetical protein